MKKFIQTIIILLLNSPFASFSQFLMSDMEKGSAAALQIQNNLMQSQNNKVNQEAQLQSQRNDLEKKKLEIEQLKLQLEIMKQQKEMEKIKEANKQ